MSILHQYRHSRNTGMYMNNKYEKTSQRKLKKIFRELLMEFYSQIFISNIKLDDRNLKQVNWVFT